MKKYLVILIVILIGAPSFSYAAKNLLDNASFEEPKDAIGANPTGWWSWNSDYNGTRKV